LFMKQGRVALNKWAHRQAGNACKGSANPCLRDLPGLTLERVMNGPVSPDAARQGNRTVADSKRQR
jgi:hypothetical protein